MWLQQCGLTFFSAASSTVSASLLRALRICEAATLVDVFSKACMGCVLARVQCMSGRHPNGRVEWCSLAYVAAITRDPGLAVQVTERAVPREQRSSPLTKWWCHQACRVMHWAYPIFESASIAVQELAVAHAAGKENVPHETATFHDGAARRSHPRRRPRQRKASGVKE